MNQQQFKEITGYVIEWQRGIDRLEASQNIIGIVDLTSEYVETFNHYAKVVNLFRDCIIARLNQLGIDDSSIDELFKTNVKLLNYDGSLTEHKESGTATKDLRNLKQRRKELDNE